jgi:V/A-type H+-transporting ATPase subunit D
MAGIKLTKNELKKQKDALKRFERYLPTLILKKQQLQMVIRQVEAQRREKEQRRAALYEGFMSWVAVFGEPAGLSGLLVIRSFETDTGNIAGVEIPVFKNLVFEDPRYDLFTYPLWVDKGLLTLKELAVLDSEIEVIRMQEDLLGKELTVTTQRVNLFEKVKIPETRENIRSIRIYLGDQQTAAVVRGKIAKNNIMRVSSL